MISYQVLETSRLQTFTHQTNVQWHVELRTKDSETGVSNKIRMPLPGLGDRY